MVHTEQYLKTVVKSMVKWNVPFKSQWVGYLKLYLDKHVCC